MSKKNKLNIFKAFFNVDITLELLEAELDPSVFFRISRQFIISFGLIKNIYLISNNQLKINISPPLHDAVTLSREKSGLLRN